jgi:hypothetical protein
VIKLIKEKRRPLLTEFKTLEIKFEGGFVKYNENGDFHCEDGPAVRIEEEEFYFVDGVKVSGMEWLMNNKTKLGTAL